MAGMTPLRYVSQPTSRKLAQLFVHDCAVSALGFWKLSGLIRCPLDVLGHVVASGLAIPLSEPFSQVHRRWLI